MVWSVTGLSLSIGLRPLSAFQLAGCIAGLGAACVSPVAAKATSCLGPITVCSSFQNSDLVFRGRVLDVSDDPPPMREEHPSPNGISLGSLTIFGAKTHMRFAVEEVFRGEAGAEIVLAGGWGSAASEKGKEYLIFAYVNPASKALTAQSVCSSTHVLTQTDTDLDIDWLRTYASADSSSFLFGEMRMRGPDQMMLPEDEIPYPIAIKITGIGLDKTVSPVHEAYRVDKLQAGAYTVMAMVPAGVTTDGPREVKLEAKSCAEVDWPLYNDSHIAGRVTDVAGAPVADLQVAIGQRDDTRSGYRTLAWAKTDADGHYDSAKVVPGDYLVLIHGLGPSNVDAHRKVFYPGVSNVVDTKTVHLEVAATIKGIDLIDAPPVASATVHARVLRADGSPVAGGRFFAANPASAVSIGGTADATGSADLALYAGEEYTVVASASGPKEQSCGGPVSFIARDGMTLDPLILDKSWQACHATPSVGHSNAEK